MELTLVRLAGNEALPTLVVGPSLGTSVTALWGACAELLADRFHVVGWELPGHGRGAPTTESFTVADLAAAVVDAVDRTLGPVPFAYAGDSVGGATGLHLALDFPERVTGVAALCTGARIGTPDGWHERAALVRASGTPVMVEGSARRWFAPGFLERRPEAGTALLHSLQDADRESYSLVCEALAAYDVRDRLSSISVPVLAIGGSDDEAAPAALLGADAAAVPGARFVQLDGVAHQAPAEAPSTVATLLVDFLRDRHHEAGMKVRRAVLGDAHVDRAVAGTTDVTRDFQDFITHYAWGSIWTRPGLARRDRSIAVLTALVAGRHFDELEFHLRAALTNGLTRDEIVEVLLQSAVYVGVPAANTAFGVAKRVLGESADG
ncbi:4-carboxymuconolactone decarboxylase [Nocardioides sp. CER19]|uniref:bifunctional 3-oxoadipate enol-lactonase/4-carboxymuconolactone decarboxylase PcaDC n=1 Tax=Nocardioides sp. CER19 TaxID=3038538 RepID=UPI002448EA56|nr:4-carboxymuconolactone decarboxylase [Nocardioides sp. CER19]MDH2412535.1 4-carboxymuconolactone decarboxylase [Nocardioides sp. CER19]